MSQKEWQNKAFNELTTNELYDILKLRVDIFVVEQTCYYPELDNHDRHLETRHVYLYQNNNLHAYLRILPKGLTYNNYVSIGRVAIAEKMRGTGLGHQLIEQGIKISEQIYPQQAIKISAQQHLEKFYLQHGFETVSAMYLEDNIPHISMLRLAQKS